MRSLGAEPYMDEQKRQNILVRINTARSKETRVSEVISAIPAWAERPFKGDQENFNAAFKTYQDNAATVRALEMRLIHEPGPIWKEITPQEDQALADWVKAVDTMSVYVNTYFPSETQKLWVNAALGAIALASFLVPIFLGNEDDGFKLPFSLEPPPIPWKPEPKPVRASTVTLAPRTTAATPVRAEVFRPSISPALKRFVERRAEVPAGVPLPSRSIPSVSPARSFVRPLGPTVPLTAATVRSGGPVSPSPTTPIHGPPRFRKE